MPLLYMIKFKCQVKTHKKIQKIISAVREAKVLKFILKNEDPIENFFLYIIIVKYI